MAVAEPPERGLTAVILWRAGGSLEVYGDFDLDHLEAEERQLVTAIVQALARFTAATDRRRVVVRRGSEP